MTHDSRRQRQARCLLHCRQIVLLVVCLTTPTGCIGSVVAASFASFIGVVSHSGPVRLEAAGRCERRRPSTRLRWSLCAVESRAPQKGEALTKGPRRWYGKTKQRITEWSEIPKSQKRSWTICDDEESVEVLKRRGETVQHPLVMAILWKLFRREYPNLVIEQSVNDPDGYIPDVVATDEVGKVVFWGESGRMSPTKAANLCRRYPDAHIVHCRWGMSLEEWVDEELMELLLDIPRPHGRFTFASISDRDVWRFLDHEQHLFVSKDDLEWMELESCVPLKSRPC